MRSGAVREEGMAGDFFHDERDWIGARNQQALPPIHAPVPGAVQKTPRRDDGTTADSPGPIRASARRIHESQAHRHA